MATGAPPTFGDTQEYGGGTQEYGGYPEPAPAPTFEQPTTATGESPYGTEPYGAEPAADDGYGADTAAAGGAGAGAGAGAGGSSTEKGDGDDGVDGWFKERRKRILTVSSMILWFAFLAMPRWFDTEELTDIKEKDRTNAQKSLLDVYNVHAAALFFVLIGLIAVFVVQFIEWREIIERNWIIDLAVGAVLLLGGGLYCIGGMAYAGYHNKYNKDFDEHESLAGSVFFESTFVGVIVIFLAADVARNVLSISQRVRIFFMWVINMLFCSVLLFFCYAVLAGSDDISDFDKAAKTDIADAWGCVAAGYFFCLMATSIYLITEFAEICCGWNDGAKTGIASFQDLILNVCNAVNVFGAFLVFAGYWAYCDTITSLKGDNVGPESESNFRAYYIGLGFFVLFQAIFIAFDISWGEFVQSRIGG